MQSRFHLFTLTVLLLLIKVSPTLSQDISFNKVSLPDETLPGTIACITQDTEGNIWLGSQGEGLSRFDGLHLKSYKNDALNPSSIANNFVECVYTDKSGIIWAGTWGGLEKFDPETGSFTHYKHDEKDSIVKGMLQHSRTSSGQKELTDINALADECLRLSYHELRAKDKLFNAEMKTDFDSRIEKINVVPQDISRVLINVINNAFYAVTEKKKAPAPRSEFGAGSKGGQEYEPTVSIATKRINSPLGVGGIEVRVTDNGNGIPQKIIDKIFQPFFTTKPTGKGTGLGLSLAYDIVTKGHDGTLEVLSTDGSGSTFIISLPSKTNG
jgi:hypothetical protein